MLIIVEVKIRISQLVLISVGGVLLACIRRLSITSYLLDTLDAKSMAFWCDKAEVLSIK